MSDASRMAGGQLAVPIEAFIRTRCSTGGRSRETLVAWEGEVFSTVPGEQQRSLFRLFGVNIARCWLDEDQHSWLFTSRELEYYLDPSTRLPIQTWTNPWVPSLNVSVMHVANDPVQFPLGPPNSTMAASRVMSGTLGFASDTHLFYPNPLFSNASYMQYAPQKMYEATELFKWFVDEQQAIATTTTEANSAHFAWTRISQFLPWMQMGDRPGRLVSTATGARRAFADLPAWLQQDISGRLPLFRHAPPCMEATSDETSWTYFNKHFATYLDGGRFPVPAPTSAQPKCQHTL